VAVRTDQRFAGHAEALHVHGMADPIAGTAIPDAEFFTRAQQKKMVVGIFVIELQQIMIDILRGQFCPHPRHLHGFESQHDQCAGRILGQGLIDSKPDLLSGPHGATDQMRCDQFLGDIFSHNAPPPSVFCLRVKLRLTFALHTFSSDRDRRHAVLWPSRGWPWRACSAPCSKDGGDGAAIVEQAFIFRAVWLKSKRPNYSCLVRYHHTEEKAGE